VPQNNEFDRPCHFFIAIRPESYARPTAWFWFDGCSLGPPLMLALDNGTIDRAPAALIIGLDCMTGLQTARTLVRHKIPVIGFAKDRKHPCCSTRVCKEIVFGEIDGEELLQILKEFGPRMEERAVLFPCTDFSVLLVSRHRRELEAWYYIVLPDANVVEMLVDKAQFHAFAEREQLAVPGAVFLRSGADAERAAQDLIFPRILKPPVKTKKWLEHAGAKAFKVNSGTELLSVYDRCRELADVLMLQEWVPGGDPNHYTCNCYFNAESKPIVTFVTQKIRQWPPEAGIGSLAVECKNDIVLEQTIDLFSRVNFRGLAYLEVKRDESTGRHLIIEPNIGRPTGRSATAEAAGVDLLYATYCDTVGWPLPSNLTQTYQGVKWIYFRRDLQASFHAWRHGRLNLKSWLRSLRGRKIDALFSWTDPGPFLLDLKHAFTKFCFPSRRGRERL
jgi:D-aspartate ligase